MDPGTVPGKAPFAAVAFGSIPLSRRVPTSFSRLLWIGSLTVRAFHVWNEQRICNGVIVDSFFTVRKLVLFVLIPLTALSKSILKSFWLASTIRQSRHMSISSSSLASVIVFEFLCAMDLFSRAAKSINFPRIK